jgi:hypothetical protein
MKNMFVVLTLLLTIFILSGCSRKGEFSKEGAYEILRGISNSQHPTRYNEEKKEEIDYQEYERKLQSMP